MSVNDEFHGSIGGTIDIHGLEQSRPGIDGYEALIDLFVSLLSIGTVSDNPRDPLFEATDIYDLLLASVKDVIVGEASSLVSHPLVDIFELVECIGPDAVYEVLVYAIDILMGDGRKSASKNTLKVFADCVGWTHEPETLTPLNLASAIIMSLTGTLNKALVSNIGH